MSIESVLYSRLSADATLTGLVGDNIFPTEATENTTLPFVVFTVSTAEPQITTTGTASLTRYGLDVAASAFTLAEVVNILGAVRGSLDGQSFGNVRACFLQSQQTEPNADDNSYIGGQSYTVWFDTATTYTATDGTTASIELVGDEVRICGTLTGCDGGPVSITGGVINGTATDLTGYVKGDGATLSAVATIPATADPAWLTPTVDSLAEAIYQEKAFDRLPILAAALEEAGCDNADILAHCRNEGPHTRGCWLVDLVLGKE